MIDNEIKNIKVLLSEIIQILSSLNDENFESDSALVKEKIDRFNLLRNRIKTKYLEEEIAPFSEEIKILTKQIKDLFDNKINEKYLQKDAVVEELKKLKNNKKLQNYRR